MPPNPFQIFPWQRAFLPDLKNFMEHVSNGFPGKCLLVTPNRRPWRYLISLFKKDKKARILPKMLTITELVSSWRAFLGHAPLRMANIFDQATLLHEVVMNIASTEHPLAEKFAHMNMEQFLPWGMRLAGILDECAIENVEPVDMANLDGELSDTASAILGAIGSISSGFRQELEKKGWTTPGLDHLAVCAGSSNIPPAFHPNDDRPVILAGFYLLSASHEKIFKSLWMAGAHVCLHTDPAIACGKAPHWACSRHRSWLEKWRASAVIAAPAGPEELTHRPQMNFFSCYDFHSQLNEMSGILDRAPANRLSTAIILGRHDTLMPTLHQLSGKKVNISMGYSLERTFIANMLKLVLAVQANRVDACTYHSRDILKLVRHPCLNMLDHTRQDGSAIPVGNIMRDVERKIINAGKFWQPLQPLAVDAEDAPCIEEFVDLFVSRPERASTLAQFSNAMEAICAFIIQRAGLTLTERYPLEAEAMFRLQTEVLPLLRDNALANRSFSLPTMQKIFDLAIGQMRIPFEADPMTGLQVIGMLESRLLHFERVIVMDATDDVLPGSQVHDPLMPDFLRTIIGLQDNRRREEAAAHNLYRLCAGASEVSFLWQEGTGHSDFYDSKKVRSRFVEQHIWEVEKANPDFLKKDCPKKLLHRPEANLKISLRRTPVLERTKNLDKAIKHFFCSPVSVSSLDAYLRCPLQFIWERIMALDKREPDIIDNLPALIGRLVHATLGDFFEEAGSDIDPETFAQRDLKKKVEESFGRQAELMGLEHRLPIDMLMTLRKTVPTKIGEYLASIYFPFSILAMETDMSRGLVAGGHEITLSGKLDRIDLRKGELWVIDYKTGAVAAKNSPELWGDRDYFRLVDAALESGDMPALNDCLDTFTGRCESIQLACYLFILAGSKYCKENKLPIRNAAWIHLRNSGKETCLLDEPHRGDMDIILDHCMAVIKMIVEHISRTEAFICRDEKICPTCRWNRLCAQT